MSDVVGLGKYYLMYSFVEVVVQSATRTSAAQSLCLVKTLISITPTAGGIFERLNRLM